MLCARSLKNGLGRVQNAAHLLVDREGGAKRRNATVTLIESSLDEHYIISLANWVRSVEHLA